MKRIKRIKRPIAIILTLLMIISTLPENYLSVFAQGTGTEVQMQEEGTESETETGSDMEAVSGGDISESDTEETPAADVSGSEEAIVSSEDEENIASDELSADDTENLEIIETQEITRVSPRSNVITVTAASDSKTYDGTPLTNGTYTYAGTLQGTDYLEVVISGTQTNAGSTDNVVTSARILNGSGASAVDVTSNYTLIATNGTLTVYKAPLWVITDSASKVYDGTALTAPGSVSGFVAGESGTFTVSGSQTNVGSTTNTYTLVFDYADENNYDLTEYLGILEVTYSGTMIEVTTGAAVKSYDGMPLTESGFTYNDNGLLPVGATVAVTTAGSQTDAGQSRNYVSSIVITDSGGLDITGNFIIGVVEGTLEVTCRPLTIVTNSASKIYDGTALIGTGTISGFAPGETADFTVTGSQTTVGSSANTYTLVFDGTALASNYYLNTESIGVLTVTKDNANVIIVTANDAAKEYDGTALTENGYTYTGTLMQGDTLNVTVSGTQTDAGSSANQIVEVKIFDAGGTDVTDSYNMGSHIDGTLTVNKAPLTITTDSDSKVYDGMPLTAGGTINGIVGTETYTFTITGSQSIAGSSNNTYTLNFDGTALASNYYLDTESIGELTVTKDNANVIIVTANDAAKVYDGTPLTESGYTYTGTLMQGDTLNVTVAGTQIDAGSSVNQIVWVKILNVLGMDVTDSYTIGFHIDGTLTVNKAPLTITTDSASKVYDGTPLTASGTITGIVAGETYTFAITGSQTIAGSSNNTYTLNFDGTALASNYYLDTESIGELTVTKDNANVIIVTANDAAKVYDGTPLTESGYTFTGTLMQGDTLNVTVSGTQTDAGSSANQIVEVKILDILGTDVTDSYTIGFHIDGTLTVNRAPLTITTDSDSKVYDGMPLTASGTITGIVAGETYTFAITGSQTDVGSSANIYSLIWDGTANATNYYVIETLGVLEVVRDSNNEIIVTTSSDSKTYDGTPLTESGYTYTGTLMQGHSLVASTLGTQTDAGSSDNIVSVTIYDAGGADVSDNYFITHDNGTLTVNKAPLTVTTDSDSKVYDGTPLTAGGTITGIVAGETYTFAITGSQTIAGSSANTYSLVWDGTAVETNYELIENIGVLEIVRDSSNEIIVTAASDSKIYDGTSLTNGSYTYTGNTTGTDILVVIIEGSQTDAGTSVNRVAQVKVISAVGVDVTDSYNIGSHIEGTLTVFKAEQTLSGLPDMIKVNRSDPFIVTPISNAEAEYPNISFQSGNTTVIDFDSNGNFVIKGVGMVTITVLAGETTNYQSTTATFDIQMLADTTSLEEVIKAAEELIGKLESGGIGNGNGQYPQAAKAEFQNAIDKAKDVAIDSGATQAEVDQAQADLLKAIEDFQNSLLTVDFTALDAAIKQTEALNESAYTAATWTALQTALTEGKATRTKTYVTQEEANAAAAAITAAISTLKRAYLFTTGFDTFTGSGSVTGTVEASYEKFVRLVIGDTELDTESYIITSSTVITLKETYLKTLSNGTYAVTVEFTDGSAEATLTINVQGTVSAAAANSSSIRTGDNVNTWLWMALLGASMLLMGDLYLIRKTRLLVRKRK